MINSCKCQATQEQAKMIVGYVLLLGGDFLIYPQSAGYIFLSVDKIDGLGLSYSTSKAHFKLSRHDERLASDVIEMLKEAFCDQLGVIKCLC